ncbi:hypothetical protein ABH942_002245 [Flavobacterium sp. 28YEA47A]|uniref:hypothetical protein n=1 Tax=Flavobacterium sp. 28YEA47A TaxID=3156276 RepID=UPI003511D84D
MEEYKKAVLAHYEAVKDNLHPHFLLHPTGAKLRGLCELLLNSLSSDDKVIFMQFFTPENLDTNLDFNHIKKIDIDKFRPLVRYMRGGPSPTSLTTIELFAILVDFQPRPIQKFNRIGIRQAEPNNEFEKVDIPQIPDDNNGEEKEKEKENIAPFNSDRNDEDVERKDEGIGADIITDSPIRDYKRMNFQSTIPQKISATPNKSGTNYVKIVFVFLLVAIGGGYLAKSDLLKEKGCMIWSEDHYEKVACDYELDPSEGRKVIPIDEQLLKYQRKVKITDTTRFLNPDGTKRFFYGKNADQQMEYFTLPGRHPETGKTLKELSDYMIKTYFMSTRN